MNNDEEKDPNLWFLNKNVISKGKTFGIPNRNIFEAVFFTSLTEYCIVSINFTKVAFVSCTVIICPIVFGLFLRGLKNRSVLQILFSSIKFHFNRRELHLRSPEYTVSKSHGSRIVYTPNEIQQLNPNNLLVFISQAPVIELEKIDYTNHPMCKEMRKWVPRFHAPKWILELPEKDRLKYHVYDEIYKRESINDIELCTEDDFREPWNKKKEAALQERIEKLKSKQEKGLSKSSETNATNELEKNVSISSDSNETNTSSTNHLSDYTSITESTETEKKNPKNNQFSAFDNYIAKSNVVSQDQTSPKFVCIKKAYDNTAEKTENIINESIEKAKSSVEEIMFQKFPDINDNETWKKIPKVEEEDTVNITSYDDDLQNELDEYENPEMEGFQDFMLSMNSTTPESDSSDFMTSLNDIPEPDMEIIVPEFLEKESND